jgi:hypothetical protein
MRKQSEAKSRGEIMGRMGFDRRTGLVYEGREGATHPIWPTPTLTQATLIEEPSDLHKVPGSFDDHPFSWMFVESSYDPTSRIRRGRVFQSFGNVSWEIVQVEAHPAVNSDIQKVANGTGRVGKELSVFMECTQLLMKRARGEGLQLTLGQRDGMSMWRILQTERIATGDVMVTLRAESAYGVLPQVDKSRIHADSVKGVEAALDRVLNSAYRELPQSVVDHCRNAAVMVISRWMQGVTSAATPVEQDLGNWIKAVKAHFGEQEMVALRSALEAINRLHPRGKDNEANKHKLRQVEDSDAEFALHALGFIIREIKWAA